MAISILENGLQDQVNALNSKLNNVGSHVYDDTSYEQIDNNNRFLGRRFGELVCLCINGVTFTKNGNNLEYTNIPTKYRTSGSRPVVLIVNYKAYLSSVNGADITVYTAGNESNKDVYGTIAYFV